MNVTLNFNLLYVLLDVHNFSSFPSLNVLLSSFPCCPLPKSISVVNNLFIWCLAYPFASQAPRLLFRLFCLKWTFAIKIVSAQIQIFVPYKITLCTNVLKIDVLVLFTILLLHKIEFIMSITFLPSLIIFSVSG